MVGGSRGGWDRGGGDMVSSGVGWETGETSESIGIERRMGGAQYSEGSEGLGNRDDL